MVQKGEKEKEKEKENSDRKESGISSTSTVVSRREVNGHRLYHRQSGCVPALLVTKETCHSIIILLTVYSIQDTLYTVLYAGICSFIIAFLTRLERTPGLKGYNCTPHKTLSRACPSRVSNERPSMVVVILRSGDQE